MAPSGLRRAKRSTAVPNAGRTTGRVMGSAAGRAWTERAIG
jgi:hypothetical protein